MQLVVGMPNPFPKAVVEARRRQFYGRNLGLDIVREDVDGDPSKRCEVAILAHLYRMHLHASLARRLRSHGGRRRAFAGSPQIVKSSPWWAWGTPRSYVMSHTVGLGHVGALPHPNRLAIHRSPKPGHVYEKRWLSVQNLAVRASRLKKGNVSQVMVRGGLARESAAG